MCAPGGGIAPLEYIAVDEAHYSSVLERLTRAPAFVAEYAAALEALGVAALVGLTILPPTHVCKARAALSVRPACKRSSAWLSPETDAASRIRIPLLRSAPLQPGEWLLEYSGNTDEDARELTLKVFPVGSGLESAHGAYDVVWVAGGIIERKCIEIKNTNVRRHLKGRQEDGCEQQDGVIQRKCIVIDSSNVRRHVRGKDAPQ